jgi:hypothetical protein
VNAGWDREVLAIDLQALVDLNFGVEIASFSLAGVDLVLDERREASPEPSHDANEEVSPLSDSSLATTRPGDLWLLGRHRLLCGDARSREAENESASHPRVAGAGEPRRLLFLIVAVNHIRAKMAFNDLTEL